MRTTLGLLAAAGLCAVLTACGSPSPAVGLPSFGDPLATGAAPTSPAPAWTAACGLLTDAEVVNAAGGTGTTMSLIDHKSTEDISGGPGRVSRCQWELLGTKGNETLSGGGVEVTVIEHGAPIYFPPTTGEQPISGIGDGAFWTDENPVGLDFRVGDRLYQIEATMPILDDVTDDQRVQINKAVLLKVAQLIAATV